MSRSPSEVASIPTPPIAPLDLAAERKALGSELTQAIERVLASGRYISGPEVERFEAAFAAHHGVPHAVAVASGTDALVLGLRALGVEAGDEVLTSPFSFFATASAVTLIGAQPRFADVELATGLLDPAAAADRVTERTKVILPVHLYGQLADMRALRTLADGLGTALLEDGAQAHGAARDGHAAGALGDACTFSFYPTKNLGAVGEGGLILTHDAETAQRLRLLRDHGMTAKYQHTSFGTNSRMDELQAALLSVKLPHLSPWNAARRAVAARYDEALAAQENLVALEAPAGEGHVYHQYTVRVAGGLDRDKVVEEMRAKGILVGVHYPTPIHLQPAASGWGYEPGDFPNAEQLAREVMCLPIHPFLRETEVERVVRALQDLG